jgi:malate dehydrogenase (oxaloacetate-decarboxylating)(NADP+)
LGFPYIFRGALDVRATQINEAMKLAAVKALAELTQTAVPDIVNLAYNKEIISFSPDYIIPKPLDPRLLSTVAPAVAKAAMESGVAQKPITDWDAYITDLNKRLGLENQVMRVLGSKARRDPRRIVFAEADNIKILKAAQIVKDEGIAQPILLGKRDKIEAIIKENSLELGDVQIIDPFEEKGNERFIKYTEFLFEKRQRRGITRSEAQKAMLDRNYFAASMVQFGDADTLISGLTKNYADAIRPALQVIGTSPGNRVAGMYMMLTKKGPVFFGDTTINVDPTVDELVDISVLLNDAVKKMNMVPRLAVLSYSNFGSSDGVIPVKTREVVKALHERYPDIIVDGEMQGNFAINNEMLMDNFPFSDLKGQSANTLIFPNLESGNIAYKLLQELGDAEAVGPILLGMNKPVHVLQLGSSVREIVNMVTIAVTDVQTREKPVLRKNKKK